MGLSDIITDAIKYPFLDIKKFLIVGVISLLAGISNIFIAFGVNNFALNAIATVIGLIFALILSGYALNVIKNGIYYSDEIPDFDWVNDFINGIKVLVIGLVYFIIPLIILILFAGIGGVIGSGLNHLAEAMGVSLIIAIIIAIIFAIFEIIAIARFANTGEFGAAFSFGEIFEEVKQIGIARIIGFLIFAIIIVIIAYVIISILALIPYVGIIIAQILIGGFVSLFYNRAIGLLYAEA